MFLLLSLALSLLPIEAQTSESGKRLLLGMEIAPFGPIPCFWQCFYGFPLKSGSVLRRENGNRIKLRGLTISVGLQYIL
ncbi:MAG: hypothetical protein AB1393_00230 [Candidatus Edwardsbacteria bacterium]